MSGTRISLLLILFILLFLAVIGRLFYWQIVEHDRLAVLAENQHFSAMEIPAKRGEIKASDGSALVTNKTAYLIYAALPEIEEEPKVIAGKLAPIFLDYEKSQKVVIEKFGEDEESSSSASIEEKEEDREKEEKDRKKEIEEEIVGRLNQPGVVWVLLKKKLPKEYFEKIAALNIKGVGWEIEQDRFYPEASMAAHLTGFVGSDSRGLDKGYFGLEGFYDGYLKGRAGRLNQEIDALGRPILVGVRKAVPPEDGQSLHTTIDRSIQYLVEKYLKEGMRKYRAKAGSVLVMEPKTGAILASASYPGYDQNHWSQYDKDRYRNPVAADTYEPGSTFKTVVMAAGLDAGVIKPETVCECSGPREVSGYKITTWNNKYYPNSTMKEVLQHSDNVGMVMVGDSLGKEKFLSYIRNFGFGKPTGVDLEEETSGILREDEEWRPIDLATSSFGQGLAVTPIQLVRAVGAIANGGKLMQPFIVKKIVSGDREVEIKPKETGQVIKPETAAAMTEMMVAAVEGGEARRMIPKGYRVAGKTGTAQIPVEGHYDPKKTIASFIGFGPVEDPRFVMLVKLDEPQSSQWGSETAAPLFFDIAKELFTYFGIPPSAQ
jgi:cell division protein FtsI/penicillin-binding protein 2